MLKKIVDKIGNPAVEDQDHVSEKVSILASFSMSDDGSIHPRSRAHAQLWGEGHARARGNFQDSVRGRKKSENEVEIMRRIRSLTHDITCITRGSSRPKLRTIR